MNISTVAQTTTCVLFALYIIGRVWSGVIRSKIKYESFKLLNKCRQKYENKLIKVDSRGRTDICIESEIGIREIKIFKTEYEITKSGRYIQKWKILEAKKENLFKEKIFVRCDLGELLPITEFEIRRSDYTKVTYNVYISGYNGELVAEIVDSRLTFLGFVYYLSEK